MKYLKRSFEELKSNWPFSFNMVDIPKQYVIHQWKPLEKNRRQRRAVRLVRSLVRWVDIYVAPDWALAIFKVRTGRAQCLPITLTVTSPLRIQTIRTNPSSLIVKKLTTRVLKKTLLTPASTNPQLTGTVWWTMLWKKKYPNFQTNINFPLNRKLKMNDECEIPPDVPKIHLRCKKGKY